MPRHGPSRQTCSHERVPTKGAPESPRPTARSTGPFSPPLRAGSDPPREALPLHRFVPARKEHTMAKKTGADILIDTLIDWGVDTVFGLPGDGINGIMEALRKKQDLVRFIQV